MLQRGSKLDLAPEPLGVDAASHLRRQHLHDHAPAERRLPGDEDTAHAPAKLALELVAGTQNALQSRREIGHGR
jgi:hypothetical protein